MVASVSRSVSVPSSAVARLSVVPPCWSGLLRPVLPVLSGRSVVGFCGSRRGVGSALAQGALFCAAAVASESGARVFVGCARGVDASVRGWFSLSSVLRVFRAAEFGSGPRSFALRSEALVRALAAEGGLLVAFPGRSAPSGLRSCRSWPWGVGSGSWGAVVLAVGLGVPVLLWLPPGVSVSAARFRPVGGGWFVSR